VIDNSERLSEPRRRAVMRENNRWILAGASAGVMLMVLEAVPAELTSDNDWAQAYGRQDKDCLEWNDTCVNCVRAQSGGDYSCSNIGIACQPKEVRCIRRGDEKTIWVGAIQPRTGAIRFKSVEARSGARLVS